MISNYSLPHRLLVAAQCGVLLFAPALAQTGYQDSADVPAPRRWSVLLERDTRVAFTPRTAVQAVRTLERPGARPDERAAALVAIGASGAVSERPRLKSWAAEGESLERQAAILGLGELARTGSDRIGASDSQLETLLLDSNVEIAECALLALLRTGKERWLDSITQMVADTNHRLVVPARDLLVFIENPSQSRPSPAAVLLLDLRWQGAKRYGTVDGQSWSMTMIDDLRHDDVFLDQVVLGSAAALGMPGVRDHLLEILLEGTGHERVRAAVRAMPLEVEKLVDAGVWSPASDEEWIALIDTAIEEDVTALMPASLDRASKIESIVVTVAGILARGNRSFSAYVVRGAEREEAADRVQAARAMGGARLEEYLDPLQLLARDSDPRVRAAATVASLRRGDRDARDRVDAMLTGPANEDREPFVEELTRLWHASNVLPLLEYFVHSLDGIDRTRVEACLHLRGSFVSTSDLRASFHDLDPSLASTARVARAIGAYPTQEDIDFVVELFPMEGFRETNVELARILIENGHPNVHPILHEAVWRGPWNRSVLAGAVVTDTAGLRLLHQWIEKPPEFASSSDIRRVGFAIGEWGGLDALEDLSRRLGGGSDRPALQGALLGALTARTH